VRVNATISSILLSLSSSITSDGLYFNLTGINQFLDVKKVFQAQGAQAYAVSTRRAWHRVASEIEQAVTMREDVFDRADKKTAGSRVGLTGSTPPQLVPVPTIPQVQTHG
jgi:hypothetical protein